MRALQQAAAVLAQTDELGELFDEVAEQVQLVVPYHTLRLFLVDDAGTHLYPVAIKSFVDDAQLDDLDDPRFRIEVGQGVTGSIAASGQAEVVYDLEAHPAAFHIPDTPRVEESLIGVPLTYQGEVLGVLTLSKHGLSQFSPEQLALLEVLAVSIGAAIAHQRALRAQARATEQEQRLRELHSTFIANVSHELRTPLTTIGGFLELARTKAGDDGDLDELIAGAQRGATRLADLVEDLLEVVAVESGRQRIALEPHDLVELVAAARDKAEVPDERLVTAHLDGVTVIVDAARIINVLAELLENACKYGPDGAPVTVRYEGLERAHIVDVIDQGGGIDQDDQEAIFQRFTQLDPSTRRRRGGTGIGLTLARAIAQWHGGGLIVVPDAPSTTFRLTLPRRPTPRSAA